MGGLGTARAPPEVPLNRAVSYPAARAAQHQQHPAVAPTLSAPGPRGAPHSPPRAPRAHPGEAGSRGGPRGEVAAYHKLMEQQGEGVMASPAAATSSGGALPTRVLCPGPPLPPAGLPDAPHSRGVLLPSSWGPFTSLRACPTGFQPCSRRPGAASEGAQQAPGGRCWGRARPRGAGDACAGGGAQAAVGGGEGTAEHGEPPLEVRGAGVPGENTRGSQASAKEVPGVVGPAPAGSRLQATAAPFPDPSRALALAPGASHQQPVMPPGARLYGYSQGELSGLGMPLTHEGGALPRGLLAAGRGRWAVGVS